ncbi:hypothetical protein D0Y65_030656 [Glycine soja]|uniref:Uncharacterized protein n=1 Tax=Glycine soja TaxID=3848 RepID=A0A445I4J3_GLYSO|nr:hypothetical protein D0Y65_030656 [Glycine soja]
MAVIEICLTNSTLYVSTQGQAMIEKVTRPYLGKSASISQSILKLNAPETRVVSYEADNGSAIGIHCLGHVFLPKRTCSSLTIYIRERTLKFHRRDEHALTTTKTLTTGTSNSTRATYSEEGGSLFFRSNQRKKWTKRWKCHV